MTSDDKRDDSKKEPASEQRVGPTSERDFALRMYRTVCRMKADLETRYGFGSNK
jgi:hypothetical protein